MTTSPTGKQAKTDTVSVSIPIEAIRLANIKLIEAKANIKIIQVKDSIITNQRLAINELDNINNDLQDRIVKANEINSKVNAELSRYKVKAKRASWAAVGSSSAFIVLLLIIL